MNGHTICQDGESSSCSTIIDQMESGTSKADLDSVPSSHSSDTSDTPADEDDPWRIVDVEDDSEKWAGN